MRFLFVLRCLDKADKALIYKCRAKYKINSFDFNRYIHTKFPRMIENTFANNCILLSSFISLGTRNKFFNLRKSYTFCTYF